MKEFPVTYELDANGESTGIAHPYCSSICQLVDLYKVPVPRHAEPIGGEEIGDEETACEGCGIYLHKEGRP